MAQTAADEFGTANLQRLPSYEENTYQPDSVRIKIKSHRRNKTAPFNTLELDGTNHFWRFEHTLSMWRTQPAIASPATESKHAFNIKRFRNTDMRIGRVEDQITSHQNRSSQKQSPGRKEAQRIVLGTGHTHAAKPSELTDRLINPFDRNSIGDLRETISLRSKKILAAGFVSNKEGSGKPASTFRGEAAATKEGFVTPRVFTRTNSSEYLFSPKKRNLVAASQIGSEKAELSSRVSSFISMVETQAEFLKVPYKLRKVVGRLHVGAC